MTPKITHQKSVFLKLLMEDHLRMMNSHRIPSLPFHTYRMQQEWWSNSFSLLRSGISPHFHVTNHLSRIDLMGTVVRINHQSIPMGHPTMIFEILYICDIKMLVLARAFRIRSQLITSMSKTDNIRSKSLRLIIVRSSLKLNQWITSAPHKSSYLPLYKSVGEFITFSHTYDH